MQRAVDVALVPFSLVAHIQYSKRITLRAQLINGYLLQVLQRQADILPYLHPASQVADHAVVADDGQLRGRLPRVAFILDHQQQAILRGSNEANAGSEGRAMQVDLQNAWNMAFAKCLW